MASLTRRSVLAGSSAAILTGTRTVVSQERVIRIGFPLELSGRFVSYGAPGKRGAEMALDAVGYRVGPFKIEALFRDVQSETQAAISAATELVVSNNVNFIVGPVASPIVPAIVPIIRQKEAIWLVPGSSNTSLEAAIGSEDYFFHTWPYAYDYHSNLAVALKEKLGEKYKRVAVIYSDDGYGRTHLPYIEKFYPLNGFEIVAKELIRANSSDLNPVLTKLSRVNADILVGAVQTTDGITLAKQIQTRRLNIPFLVGTAYTQLAEWQAAVGEAQEGWLGVTTFLPGLERSANKDYPKLFPKLSDWAAAFKARYNMDPDFLDVTIYATVALLLIAIERAGTDDKVKVGEALSTMDIETINGEAKFVPSGGGTKHQAFTQMLVFQRQKGQNAIVYPKALENGQLIALTR